MEKLTRRSQDTLGYVLLHLDGDVGAKVSKADYRQLEAEMLEQDLRLPEKALNAVSGS